MKFTVLIKFYKRRAKYDFFVVRTTLPNNIITILISQK